MCLHGQLFFYVSFEPCSLHVYVNLLLLALRPCDTTDQVVVATTFWRYPLRISVKLPFIVAVMSVQGNTATESSVRTLSLLLGFPLSQNARPSPRSI